MPKPDAADLPIPLPEAQHAVSVASSDAVEVLCDHSGFAAGIGVMLREGRSSYSLTDAAALVAAGLGKVASKSDSARIQALKPTTEPKE